ncbi:MAG: hypothetical protein AB7D47_05210 [Desulfovibrio sp.]|jgi:hypothetical protein
MHIRPQNVLKAICHGHDGEIHTQTEPRRCARLVDISATSARLILLADPAGTNQELLHSGEAVALAPQFLEPTAYENIRSKVTHVQGADVNLRFETPLSLPVARLLRLTRR